MADISRYLITASYLEGVLGANWPNTDGKVWDNAVVRAYGVNGVPSNVLVGKDGKILSTDARGPQLDTAIEDALK